MKSKNNAKSSVITGMIDVHSHVIPKVDDGSRYWGETKVLLSMAYEQGIRGIIATPHYIRHHNRMSSAQIMEQMENMQRIAGQIAPDLKIFLGQELFYFEGAAEAVANGRVLTMAGTKYVLMEFSPRVSYGELYQAVRSLVCSGYIPVLAHVERYACLRTEGRIEEVIQAGARMQMNYQSLSEPDIRRIRNRNWCRKMVLAGNVHLLGTDMHRLDYRPPDIVGTVEWIRKKAGDECLRRLTVENPARLLAGEML